MADVDRNPSHAELRNTVSDQGHSTRSLDQHDDNGAVSYRPGDTGWSNAADINDAALDAGRAAACSNSSSPKRHEADELDRPSRVLARTIENDIIPRLLQAHRAESQQPTIPRPLPSARDVDDTMAFATFVIANDEPAINASVKKLLARGRSFDDTCLDLLAPAARHIGDFWWNDTCSFLDVTLALCKLQNVLRDLGNLRDDVVPPIDAKKSILLTAPPSNQHMFGFRMVEDFFRRADWTVCGLPGASLEDMVVTIRRDWFAVVGLSVGCEDDMPKLKILIATLRAASRNRSIVVLVGGPSLTDKPEQAVAIGADATANDARQAVAQAERLVTSIKRN